MEEETKENVKDDFDENEIDITNSNDISNADISDDFDDNEVDIKGNNQTEIDEKNISDEFDENELDVLGEKAQEKEYSENASDITSVDKDSDDSGNCPELRP
jgi:hypothetical protein